MSWALLAATSMIAIWGFYRAWQLNEYMASDEPYVLGQVKLFLAGKPELYRMPEEQYPASAMLPGFQSLLALVAAPLGNSSPSVLRLYCFLLSLPYPLVVYAIARRMMSADQAVSRAAQAYLLPVVFPFNALLYTDVFSLLVNLTALWACLRRSYTTAGALMLLSLCVRQTNVVFLLFLCGFSYLEENGPECTPDRILGHLRRCWLLLIGIVAFGVFVFVNGRVGLDDPLRHQLTFSFGNLIFSVLTGGILFLPLFVSHAGEILRWAVKYRLEALLILALTAGVAFTYAPTHKWNRIYFYLRNQVLIWLLDGNLRRALLTICVAATIISLLARGLSRPSASMLYVYWFLSLAPFVLVEPRCYFGTLLLYQIFRKPEKPAVEIALWCWFAAFSIGLEYTMTATEYVL